MARLGRTMFASQDIVHTCCLSCVLIDWLSKGACHSNRAQFRRVIALSPGIDSSLQRTDAQDALSMKQQRHPCAAHLVRTGTVENDVAVARNLLLTKLHLIHRHVKRTPD